MIQIRLLAICLALFAFMEANAQVLMPPGGPAHCQPNVVNGGQQSAIDAETRVMEVWADGALGETHFSHATAEFQFEAVSSYSSTIEIGVIYAGTLSGGVTAEGSINIFVELRDLDNDVLLGSHSVLNETRDTLGAAGFNNILQQEVASFEVDLVHGRTYEVRLRAEAEANGVNGEADFLNGNRQISFSCVTVHAGLEDTDGDGIFDLWETVGIDIDNDGMPDLLADELGTDYAGNPIVLDPNRKDILVEIDWFECAAGGDCDTGDTHTHEPRTDALDASVAAFDDAPVSNPNGADDGIALWLMTDEALPHQAVCDFDDGCFDTIKSQRFGTVVERADADLMLAKRMVWHYNLWVHDKEPNNSSSGEAERPGNDFIVSLGSWMSSRGSTSDQIGTLMHELGHNLNLSHGGGDGENCKPNYLSIMNYMFQTAGLQRTAPGSVPFYDYSRTSYPTSTGILNEASLNELIGIEDDDLMTFFGPPIDLDGVDNGPNPDGDLNDDLIPAVGNGPIDWDQNGSASDNPATPTDINFAKRRDCGETDGSPDASPDDDLYGYVDWDNLLYNFRTTSEFEDGVHGEDRPVEIDFETSESFKEAIWRARANKLYRYDAKLLCGVQTDPSGLRMTHGQYATVINILNPSRRPVRFRKSLALAFPPIEQTQGETYPISMDELDPGHALKVDCEDLQRNVFNGTLPANYIDGFVTILSPQLLEVQGVYTTSPVNNELLANGHSSIEIERYEGTDLSSDLRTLKRADFIPVEVIDNYTINIVLFEITVLNDGASDAINVTLEDELRLLQTGPVVTALSVLDDPIDVPAGGDLTVTQTTDSGVRVNVSMGDIPKGATRIVRFLAIVPTYQIAGAEPGVVTLVDTATASFTGYEANPNDNSDTAIVELLP